MRECTTVLDRKSDDSKARDVPRYEAKKLLYQYLIIQAASDACASYLHKQMLHNAVASSVKAG